MSQKVGSLMKVKKTKNSNLWFASSELNQILAIQLFRKFCPVNFFLIPFRAIWNFSYLLKPTLNGFFRQGGRSRISLNLDSHTLLALLLCPPFIFGVGVKKTKMICSPQCATISKSKRVSVEIVANKMTVHNGCF